MESRVCGMFQKKGWFNSCLHGDSVKDKHAQDEKGVLVDFFAILFTQVTFAPDSWADPVSHDSGETWPGEMTKDGPASTVGPPCEAHMVPTSGNPAKFTKILIIKEVLEWVSVPDDVHLNCMACQLRRMQPESLLQASAVGETCEEDQYDWAHWEPED